MAARARGCVAVSIVLLLPTGCEFPQDPRNTLVEAIGDTLHVGVVEAAPWVIRSGAEAEGVEPELVRRFARSIDAEISWSWGSTEEHMEALTLYALDVAVGGFTRSTPWRKHVGLTQPYHTTRVVVAGPPGAPPVTEEAMEDRVVAVPPGGAVAGYVRQEGGEPLPLQDLSEATGLLAAPAWQLHQLGRDTTGSVLLTRRHVMAVPPGENRLLMALENVLHGADVAALLQRRGGGGR